MNRRVKVVSDGTPVNTTVLVDGEPLLVVGVDVRVYAPLTLGRTVVITLDLNDVDLEIVTPTVCGAPHPQSATVRCEQEPHGIGQAHAGQGYVWQDER